MLVNKKILSSLDQPYAVGAGRIDGKTVFFAASEGRAGRTLMFAEPDFSPSIVAEGPGGCMSLLPDPQDSRSFLAIEEFFPIFQSERAGIALYFAAADPRRPWNRRRLFDLPFVHRIALVSAEGAPTLLAATLCSKKVFRDDWSSPGAIYRVKLHSDAQTLDSDDPPILDGLTKNHGMYVQEKNHRQIVYIGAEEGIFAIDVPQVGEQWHSERIIDLPTSDMAIVDLDGDGEDEIVTIEPFHGSAARIYKQVNGKWQPVAEFEVSFGHVVWAGNIRGETSIILGSRADAKELRLIRLTDPGSWQFSSTVLDEGTAPTNIVVVNNRQCDLVVASNGETGEIVLYEIGS